MSTLSHNRGKERTHDHDQNTPQTLCTQRNREALSEHKTTCTKSSLGSNFGRAENLDHPLILVFRQSSQTHCRSYPDITLKSDARHARHHAQLWESCLDVRYWCPAWSKSCLDIKNKTHEDLQVQIHRKITQTPQHRHCYVRKPMIT